jgi:hypothetical protein
MFITEGNVVSFIMVDAIMRYQVQVDVTWISWVLTKMWMAGGIFLQNHPCQKCVRQTHRQTQRRDSLPYSYLWPTGYMTGTKKKKKTGWESVTDSRANTADKTLVGLRLVSTEHGCHGFGGVTQEIELLPSKHEVLSSNPSWACTPRRYLNSPVYSSTIHNGQNMDSTSVDEWIKKLCIYIYIHTHTHTHTHTHWSSMQPWRMKLYHLQENGRKWRPSR